MNITQLNNVPTYLVYQRLKKSPIQEIKIKFPHVTQLTNHPQSANTTNLTILFYELHHESQTDFSREISFLTEFVYKNYGEMLY